MIFLNLMKIEYYPNYEEREKLFINPKTLDGVTVYDGSPYQISLFSTGGVHMKIPSSQVPEGTLHSPEYFILDDARVSNIWGKLYLAVSENDRDLAKSQIQRLESLVTDKTPLYYKESNDQYEKREFQKVR